MKKFFAILLAVVLTFGCVAACTKTEPKTDVKGDSEVVGTWTLTKAKVMGMELSAEDIGVKMGFTFNADGTGSMDNDGEEINGLSWSQNGNTVTLGVMGEALYDLTLENGQLLLHEPENDVDMIFEKK